MIEVNWITELIGFTGSILVLISMLYNTSTYRGAFLLRLLNAIGSIIFVVYGVLLKAPSTVGLNIFAAVFNIYYIFRLKKDYN